MDFAQNLWETDERNLVEGGKDHHQNDGGHPNYFSKNQKCVFSSGFLFFCPTHLTVRVLSTHLENCFFQSVVAKSCRLLHEDNSFRFQK